jgi:hypothetical protein
MLTSGSTAVRNPCWEMHPRQLYGRRGNPNHRKCALKRSRNILSAFAFTMRSAFTALRAAAVSRRTATYYATVSPPSRPPQRQTICHLHMTVRRLWRNILHCYSSFSSFFYTPTPPRRASRHSKHSHCIMTSRFTNDSPVRVLHWS